MSHIQVSLGMRDEFRGEAQAHFGYPERSPQEASCALVTLSLVTLSLVTISFVTISFVTISLVTLY